MAGSPERILAIELFNAAQALDFRRPKKSSSFIEEFIEKYRTYVQFIEEDKVMYEDINKTIQFLQEVEYILPDALISGV